MELNCPVVGIDVAKESSVYCVFSPSGTVHLKPFQVSNDAQGLYSVLETLKKMEETFGSWPILVIESTGHYSSRLVHFFTRNALEVFLINPIISHFIKNSGLRKAKTDKLDSEELARLPFVLDLRKYQPKTEQMANLQILCRTAYHLSEQKVAIINQLVATLDRVWPGFTKVFNNVASKTTLEFLRRYPSPARFLNSQPEKIIRLIMDKSRRGRDFAETKYRLLLDNAKEALLTGIQLEAFFTSIKVYVGGLKQIEEQLDELNHHIKKLSAHIPDVALLESIPGIGENLAPLIVSEIGGIDRFKQAKQLVAYCGVDPSVRQSGNFIGTRNKVTKRGSPFLRRALYIAATVAIRKASNGNCVNPVLRDYYEHKTRAKAKKQALGAIMNKLVHIIFSVLKNRTPFVLITAEEQRARFGKKLLQAA